MYKCDEYSVSISIDLDPGLYLFTEEASTGKSFLCRLLKRYCSYGEPVKGITATDFENKYTLRELIGNKHYEVIMLDRYAMYPNYDTELLEHLSKDSIILIASKQIPNEFDDIDICSIIFEEGSLRVV